MFLSLFNVYWLVLGYNLFSHFLLLKPITVPVLEAGVVQSVPASVACFFSKGERIGLVAGRGRGYVPPTCDLPPSLGSDCIGCSPCQLARPNQRATRLPTSAMVIKTISKRKSNKPFQQQNVVNSYCIGKLGDVELSGVITVRTLGGLPHGCARFF